MNSLVTVNILGLYERLLIFAERFSPGIFVMFRKTSFVLIFCLLVQSSTGSANGKLQNASFKSVLGDKIPQSVDQTFNINNWGLGKIERKLLTDIKAKIDSLTEKGKLRFILKLLYKSRR